MQSTVSVLMAAIVFIVEFFSGILSSASDREPAKPDKPDKPAVSSTLTVFSRNDEFSDLVGKYQPEGARLNFVSEYIDFEDYDDVLEYGWRGQTVDIIICDSAEICRFLDSVLPMKDIGISEAEVSGLFSFNTESGRNSSGELCALPVVNAPGVFLYQALRGEEAVRDGRPGDGAVAHLRLEEVPGDRRTCQEQGYHHDHQRVRDVLCVCGR